MRIRQGSGHINALAAAVRVFRFEVAAIRQANLMEKGRTPGASAAESIPELVVRLYDLVQELERLFPGRRFTPDGHLVGSIGEVLAAHHYGLELCRGSEPVHDAKTEDGRCVQIKATQGKRIGLRSEPALLLVLELRRDGSFGEVFNGPGRVAWNATGRQQRNGQSPIAVSKLRRLMESVPNEARIRRVT